jgi:hypothetical protein
MVLDEPGRIINKKELFIYFITYEYRVLLFTGAFFNYFANEVSCCGRNI